MGAVPCCFSEELNSWKHSATWHEKEEPVATAFREAKDLIFSLIKRFTQCDKRRVAPPWSVPEEVWIQAVLPNWRNKKDNAVGAVNQKIAAPTFIDLLTSTLAQTIATCQTPLHAHHSQGADVAKSSGKLRFLHVLCPFWTQVYSIWFKQWESKQESAHWEHGFFRHKRREEAIIVCEQAGHEAAQEGHGHHRHPSRCYKCFCFHHPYGLCGHYQLTRSPRRASDARSPLTTSAPPWATLWETVSYQASSHSRTGGNSHGTRRDVWPDPQMRLLRTLPWLPGVPSAIDISTVAFADIGVVNPIRINTQSTPYFEARRMIKMATDEAEHLTREIAKECYAQNIGKAELPRLHGTGSHLVHRELNNQEEHPLRPRIVTEARHLGPYCHFKSLAHKECQRRISVANRSAPVAYGIWRTGASYVTKRFALLAQVVGPLMSAAEGVLCASAEWKKFDKTICVYARRALNGHATKKTLSPDGTTTYSSWSNEKVRRYWRLPTAHTEARVRRLRWAQELSRRPQTHCQPCSMTPRSGKLGPAQRDES